MDENLLLSQLTETKKTIKKAKLDCLGNVQVIFLMLLTMKKTFFLTILCLIGTMELLAQPSPFKPFTRKDLHAKELHNSSVYRTSASQEVVLSEDFSLMAAGTEDAPDNTPITTEANWFLDNKWTVTPGWWGLELYQAGGACLIKRYYSEYYGETLDGYISTPEMELYGTSTLTFRARRTGGDGTQLFVTLCDNTTGILDKTNIDITGEWATYTFTSDKATFNNKNVFQLNGRGVDFLIDDIKIERVINKIAEPGGLSYTNNSSSSFNMSWEPVDDATSYLLNLYYLDYTEGVEKVSGSLCENFDAINVNDDGMTINTANPNYPEGWTFSFMPEGTRQIYTTEGDYNSGPNALALTQTDDFIQTPVLPAPMKKISLWIKPTDMSDPETFNYSMLAFHVYNSILEEWEWIANIPPYWLEENGGVFTFEGDEIGDGCTALRLVMYKSDEVDCNFIIDDLQIDYETQKTPQSVLDDYELKATSYRYNGEHPECDYYFTVRAKNDYAVSDETYPTLIDGLKGVKPVVLPASDITENSFTANWEPMPRAESYTVSLSKVIRATEDNSRVEIIHEDFNRITEGTLEEPVKDEQNILLDLKEEGLTDSQWMLTQPQFANGMAGSYGIRPWAGNAGLVISPRLDLSNNGGAFDVVCTVVPTQPDEKIAVVIIDDPYQTSTNYGCEITMGEPFKPVTAEIHFKEGGHKDALVCFMAMSGKGFFVDDVAIYQDLKAGEAIKLPVETVEGITGTSYIFKDLDKGTSYSYSVMAQRNKNFMDYYSDFSDYAEVFIGAGGTSIEGVDVSDNSAPVEYYNLQGMKVTNPEQGKIYILRNGTKVKKVIIR